MGKSPQPLLIGVIGMDMSLFASLQEQGHTVEEFPAFEGYDLIVGPRCWRLLPHLTRYLPLALKEARAAAKKRKPRATADRSQ